MNVPEHVLTPIRVAAGAAAGKKACDIVAFDVTQQLAITDVFLIASGKTERQVGAIVDSIEEELARHKRRPARKEGGQENRWVLLDYLDFVIHVQHIEERAIYNLERLWKDCPQIDLGIDLPEKDDAEAV